MWLCSLRASWQWGGEGMKYFWFGGVGEENQPLGLCFCRQVQPREGACPVPSQVAQPGTSRPCPALGTSLTI